MIKKITRENAHKLGLFCFDEVLENFFYKATDKTANPLDTKTRSLGLT